MYSFLFGLYLASSFAVSEAEPEFKIPDPPIGSFQVTLLVYTGFRDPVWRISKYKNPEISNLLLQAKSVGNVYQHKCIPPKTGYKGFLVQESEGEQVVVGSVTIRLQLLLLDSMPCLLPLTRHYREKIRDVIISGNVSADCPDTEIAPGNDTGEIYTYNASSAPAYNPHRWNVNDTIRRKNNCYNYALDQTTNTYAQPGKESDHIYSEISGDAIRDAAVRDGWVVLNESDPVSAASDGDEHLVALFVTPGSCNESGDFHWYRLDNNGTWSHKPGQGRATNLDDSNHTISDPRKADTGVYKFVCFMTAEEDVVINATQEGNDTQCGLALPACKPKGKGAAVCKKVVDIINGLGIFPNDCKFLCRIAWVESKYGEHPRTYRDGYHGGIWQVDKIAYRETVTQKGLKKYRDQIKKKLGIDWTKTTWKDLEKPLYSALAARLHLAKFCAPIPADLKSQARYWKKHYNTAAGKGTVQKFIDDVNKANGCAK